MFFQAAPYFFIALVLVDFFAIEHHWLPVGQGFNGEVTSPGWTWAFISNALEHAILPAFTIVLTSVAGWMLQMRNVMITTISEDYVIAAQAKGLSKRRVIFTYSARNALLPQLQGFGLALGFVVSGALIMEIVFSYPGIGYLLLEAVQNKDFPLMQAIFLVITFAVLVANLVVDLIIVFFDPRARAPGGSVMKSLANIWRNLPLKAKVGIGLLGFFILAAIIGPMVQPYDPSPDAPDDGRAVRPALVRHHPGRARTSCPRC